MNQSEIVVNQRWTHFGILIDRSKSMESLNTAEIAGACQSLIKDGMTDEIGDRVVTTTIANFDESFEVVKRNISAKDLVISKEDIVPRGMTCLVPSVARLINIMKDDIDNYNVIPNNREKPGTVVFILLSDGEQTCYSLRNAKESDKKYEGDSGYTALSELVNTQEDIHQWKFFFLGANMDVIPNRFKQTTCINYSHNTKGGTEVLRSTSSAIGRFQNTSASENRSADFVGYTNSERESSIVEEVDNFSMDAACGGLITPDIVKKNSYSHRQWNNCPWEKYSLEQSELIDKISNTIESGSILLPGTDFEIRWGLMATSKMMRDIPSTKMIQVNRNTGFTRLVMKNE